MGEKGIRSFQLSFNASLKIDFQGRRVSLDGGLILVRELDERLGLRDLIHRRLTDPLPGNNTQLPVADLLRQSVYSRQAEHEDGNDAERLSQEPTFRRSLPSAHPRPPECAETTRKHGTAGECTSARPREFRRRSQ